MRIATTELHTIELQGNNLALIDYQSTAVLETTSPDRNGILQLLGKILDLETEQPEAEEQALTLTSAAWDQEFQRREKRDELLQSLCAQIEISQGKTPFPELQ